MDLLNEYQSLDDEALKDRVRLLSREALDEQFQQLSGQHAVISQRLEALCGAARHDRFLAIRAGDLAEIDREIAANPIEKVREAALLKQFRDLNRILMPFMDVYEDRVLADFQHMSREELETVDANIDKHLAATAAGLQGSPEDLRRQQDAGGTLRLAALMRDAVRKQLRERFGVEKQ